MSDILRQACKQEYFLLAQLDDFKSQIDTIVVYSEKKKDTVSDDVSEILYTFATPEMKRNFKKGNYMNKNMDNENLNGTTEDSSKKKMIRKIKSVGANISNNIFETCKKKISSLKKTVTSNSKKKKK